MRNLAGLAVLVVAVAAPASAGASDYGRWRVGFSSTINETWSSPATTPCAITGNGSVSMRADAKPFVVRLRYTGRTRYLPATWWTGAHRYAVKDMRVHVDATDAANAVRQPPGDPDGTCAWPDPATYSCGVRSYDAHLAFGGGPIGVAVDRSTHFFDFQTAAHEPDGRACGPGADTDFAVYQRRTPQLFSGFHPSRRTAAKRRRLVMREHACGTRTSRYDTSPYPEFPVSDSRCRDARLTLTPVR